MLCRFLIGLSLLVWWLPAAVAEPDPLAQLQRMATVARELNYSGAFTYEHRSAMESFRVYHWVEDGRTHRRLEYLNSPDGAVVERRAPAGCHTLGYRLLHSSGQSPQRLDRYYRVSAGGLDWVAGRRARLIEVRPRDQWRYGYLLSLDEQSGLLLRAMLIDNQQRVLERFQFVELNIEPDAESVRAQLDSSTEAAGEGDCADFSDGEPERWQLSWLPPGFAFAGQKRLDDQIDMLMYTDGLASFSVFLHPVAGNVRLEGRARRGATSAYMGQLSVGEREYRVTVVGEIPGEVAEQLARAISILPGAPNRSGP